MKSRYCLPAVLSIFFLLGGCATSRSVLDIPAPTSANTGQSNEKEVFINSSIDRRVFEVNPSSPNIPSLDPSEDQNDRIKVRSIGRKRNGFGKALGDILLKDGQTVETLTAASIRQAFIEKGYREVTSKDQITNNTYVVDASIDKFWSWMAPGFATITLSTEISTDLVITSPENSNKQTISVKASNSYQTGMEGNWIEVINKALRAYVDELKSKMN